MRDVTFCTLRSRSPADLWTINPATTAECGRTVFASLQAQAAIEGAPSRCWPQSAIAISTSVVSVVLGRKVLLSVPVRVAMRPVRCSKDAGAGNPQRAFSIPSNAHSLKSRPTARMSSRRAADASLHLQPGQSTWLFGTEPWP